MNAHENWLKQVKSYKEEIQKMGLDLELPPPSLKEIGLEYVEVFPEKRILAKVPYQKKFSNPIGLYQGGFIAAALDEVFGPLSYMTAMRPCMTLSMNISYLKPFTEKMSSCFIDAVVLQKTKSFIFMRAEVKSLDEELLAHAETHVAILRDEQLQRLK
jgi:uncharacterized protein (TIGR00369 family)